MISIGATDMYANRFAPSRPAPAPPPTVMAQAQRAARAMAANAREVAAVQRIFPPAPSAAPPPTITEIMKSAVPTAKPLTLASRLAASPVALLDRAPKKKGFSFFGGGGGDDTGGGGSAPDGAPTDASVPGGAVDYSGTGYQPNRGGGGPSYGGGYGGGGGADAGAYGGYDGSSSSGGGAMTAAWGSPASGAGASPGGGGTVQSAGGASQPVPAAAVSGSIGKDDWPWIVGIGVAAVAAVLYFKGRG